MRLDFLAALSGVMIAFQARANGELSHRLNNSLEAALVSFGSGLLIIGVIALFHPGIKLGIRKLRIAISIKKIPRWRLFAGALGGCFVALQTHIVPLVGVAIYSIAAIAGQTAVSLIVDRIGLTGGGVKHISARRIAAAVTTILAVFISVFDRLGISGLTANLDIKLNVWIVFLAGCAGALVGLQRALNGQLNEYSENSATTSLLNFIMGTSFLIIALIVAIAVSGNNLAPLPNGPWWIYTGGVIGIVYIAFTATIVQHLGVLTFTVFSVGGTLVGSLIIDIYSPSAGVHVSWYLVAGIILTYLGTIFNGANGINRATGQKPR